MRGTRDQNRLLLFENSADRQSDGTGYASELKIDAIPGQFTRGDGGIGRLRLVVANDQFKLSSPNASGLIDVIDGDLRAEQHRLSKRGLGPRQ